MPIRDWRTYASIGGLVLAGLAASGAAFYGFAPTRLERPEYPYEARSDGYYAGGAQCAPGKLAPLPPADRQAAADKCAEAAEQHRLQNNGLLQATRSAKAAEDGASLSYIGTQIGLVLAILSAWGLAVTVWAAFAASRAAVYAKDAATEGKRAADIAQKALDRSDRPFMIPNRVHLENLRDPTPGNETKLVFRITNFGLGPALMKKYFMAVADYEELPDKPEYPYLWDTSIVIPPGEHFQSLKDNGAFLQFPDGVREAVVAGERKLIIVGYLEYTDISGTHHTTKFTYLYRPNTSALNDAFIPMDGPAFWAST